MTDFEKAGILTEIAGKDYYISVRCRIFSKMRIRRDGSKRLPISVVIGTFRQDVQETREK